jgi:SWI/SNF-related matrix-associated actin-dependent regulator 1 of chromatin subfamily A
VVPASTLSNWENELRRFCAAFHVLTYHGSQNERAALRYEIRSERAVPDVILTTYTIFERESNKADRAFMQSLQLEYLVLDEAHGIKNAQSSRFVNLNMLKTRHRLLLSGTPVQNDIGELLSMLSFLMPQVCGVPLVQVGRHCCHNYAYYLIQYEWHNRFLSVCCRCLDGTRGSC